MKLFLISLIVAGINHWGAPTEARACDARGQIKQHVVTVNLDDTVLVNKKCGKNCKNKWIHKIKNIGDDLDVEVIVKVLGDDDENVFVVNTGKASGCGKGCGKGCKKKCGQKCLKIAKQLKGLGGLKGLAGLKSLEELRGLEGLEGLEGLMDIGANVKVMVKAIGDDDENVFVWNTGEGSVRGQGCYKGCCEDYGKGCCKGCGTKVFKGHARHRGHGAAKSVEWVGENGEKIIVIGDDDGGLHRRHIKKRFRNCGEGCGKKCGKECIKKSIRKHIKGIEGIGGDLEIILEKVGSIADVDGNVFFLHGDADSGQKLHRVHAIGGDANDFRVNVRAAGGRNNDGRSEPRIALVRASDIETGRAWLGVAIVEVPEALSDQFDIEGMGVLVDDVIEGSPADAAGFEVHDVILSVGGEDVEGETGRAIRLVSSRKAGDDVDIVVLRDGDRKTLRATLGSRDEGRKGTKHKWKFQGSPRGEVEEEIHTRGKMLWKSEDGNWIFKDLGDLEELENLPDNIRQLIPRSGSRSTVIRNDGEHKMITTKVKRDGNVIVIQREGDGEITVTRVDDGKETEKVYEDENELREVDEEAFEFFHNAGDLAVIHLDVDGIGETLSVTLDDLNDTISDFDFTFDVDDFKGNALEWKEKAEQWRHQLEESLGGAHETYEIAMDDFEGAMEQFHEAIEELKGRHELPDDLELPGLPRFFHGKGGHAPQAQHRRLGFVGKSKHNFEVQTDGTIEVRIRKGDSELVQLYEDQRDLERRSPRLYEKYEELMAMEDE